MSRNQCGGRLSPMSSNNLSKRLIVLSRSSGSRSCLFNAPPIVAHAGAGDTGPNLCEGVTDDKHAQNTVAATKVKEVRRLSDGSGVLCVKDGAKINDDDSAILSSTKRRKTAAVATVDVRSPGLKVKRRQRQCHRHSSERVTKMPLNGHRITICGDLQ